MTGRTYRVRGRVQGVGFRWWTRRTALSFGLAGWVRNEQDGSVVLAAWGEESALADLERWLAEGPVGARVEGVEVLPAPSGSAPADFSIERR